jgi:hypothetical protein
MFAAGLTLHPPGGLCPSMISNQSFQRKSEMPRGGRRAGAGRKPGAAAKKTREAANLILASGTTPLGYFQGLLEGTMAFDEVKFEAAKAAAPYVHARLAAVEHSGHIGIKRAAEVSDDELANIASRGSEGTSETTVDPSKLN